MIPALGVVVIHELVAPQLSETVGYLSGFGFTFLAMVVVISGTSSSIETIVVAVIATALGSVAWGEPYNRWDYYGACFAFGAWYSWVFRKSTRAIDKMEIELEQQEPQAETQLEVTNS